MPASRRGSARYAYLIVLAACALVAVAAVRWAPYFETMPWDLVAARTGHPDLFMVLPLYPSVLALALRLGGIPGIFWVQAFLYLACVALAMAVLRAARANSSGVLLAGCAVGLHPDMVLHIKRIVDTQVQIALLLGIVGITVCLRRRAGTAVTLGLGVVLGLAWLVRGNYALLLLPALLWLGRRRAWRLGGVLILTAAFTATAGNAWVNGRLSPTPINGDYNLLAGANPWTGAALLATGDEEFSLARFHDPRFTPGPVAWSFAAAHRELYRRMALDFIGRHPARYVEWTALRLFNLVRPELRHSADSRVAGMWLVVPLQCLLACIAPLWLILRWLRREYRSPFMAAWFIALLGLPLLLVNAQPRYMLPLQILMLLDLAVLLTVAPLEPGSAAGIPNGDVAVFEQPL